MAADTGTTTFARIVGDLLGGLAAMLVALPSSIAFGVLVFTAIGPEHAGIGATAGALGAAALGLTSSLVGRNGGFVTAPCAPAAAVMAALAGSLAVDHHLPVDRVIALMVVAALISAALQVIYGAVRLGRLIKYIPYQVVTGYLSGVALIIALGQLPKLLGLPDDIELLEGVLQPGAWRWQGIVVGVVTIGITAGSPLVTKRIPAAILGLAAGLAAYFALGAFDPGMRTLTDNALVVGPIEAGSVWEAVKGRALSLRTIELADIQLVLAAAATLSVLLSIDTLKTGVVLDALTRSRHDSNRELVGQGVGNAVAALAGGMPGAGTTGPTLVNVTSGGRSPLSGFAVGALSLVAFLALGQYIAWVPIGALAGILLVIAWKMFDWKIFKLLLHRQTRLDFFVIVAVVVVAETVGLIEASAVGVGLTILLFIRRQIRSSVLLRRHDLRTTRSTRLRGGEAGAVLDAHGDRAMLVELQGDLFFGTTDHLFTELSDDLDARSYILLDFRRVDSMDYTAGHLLEMMRDRLQDRGGQLLVSGLPSSLPTRQDIEKYMAKLGLVKTERGIPIFEHRDAAVEWMEDRILASAGWTPPDDTVPLELHEFRLFKKLDAAALEALVRVAEPVSLPPGATLFRQGDVGDEMYLVRRGALSILLQLPGGKRHKVATVTRGESFGEIAFIDHQPRSADVEAPGGAELFKLSRTEFNQVAKADGRVAPAVFKRLARLVSERLRAANAELRALEER